MSEKEESKSFENLMQKLENIVQTLEKGDLNLDESIEKFEEGMKISKECNKMLYKISCIYLEPLEPIVKKPCIHHGFKRFEVKKFTLNHLELFMLCLELLFRIFSKNSVFDSIFLYIFNTYRKIIYHK